MSNIIKINVSNLSVFYERHKVINNMNVCINDRNVTTFIGPSGCGKTTFLRCLNRMNDLFPSFSFQGKILLDNLNIYDKSITLEHLRSRVGMVFQRPVPFVMSIYDNVAYGPRIHRLVSSKNHLDDIVEKSLRQAFLWKDVSSRLHKSALSLSGGQQQRLCIARAIAIEPDVILMDEPTSSLDPVSTAKIEELIDHLKKKYCIVMITHSMNQAARVSDMVGFIYESNMVEFGPCQDMFTNPTNKLTQDYITGCY